MNFQNRHFGQIGRYNESGEYVSADVGALLRRLILFDECRLESDLLKEIPDLVSVFGANGLLELMDSGAIQVSLDVMVPAEIGNLVRAGMFGNSNPNHLPPDSLRFGVAEGITEGEHRFKYVSRALEEVRKSRLQKREDQRLRYELSQRVLLKPREAGRTALSETCSDFERRDPILLEAIRMAYAKDLGSELPSDVDIVVERLAEKDFRIRLTDSKFSDSDVGKEVIKRGALAVAGLNQTINCMSYLDALTGLQDSESRLFSWKMRTMADRLLSGSREAQFDRVVQIGGLPSLGEISPDTKIDVKKLIEIRQSSECATFRNWVNNLEAETDDTIADQFSDLKSRVAYVMQSKPGRTARFITTTFVGNIPVVGTVLGPALGAADEFFANKVIGKPGPAIFLSHSYPSLFKEQRFDSGSNEIGYSDVSD